MRVLIFQAAVSAVGIAALGRFADQVRAEGHQAGLRSLPHFRREKEPADVVVVALSPMQADQYKTLGAELVAIFQDTDKIVPVQLPDDEKELEEFDFDSAVSGLDGPSIGYMTIESLRSEAIERGLEVTAATTREELEHAIGVDVPSGLQAGDRVTDRLNSAGAPEDRIGLRTSTVLPSVNGLDLERMNDEQLKATALNVGVTVSKNQDRATIINNITKTFAKKAAAPEGSGVKSPAETYDADLTGLDEDGLRAIAEREEIDLGRSTSIAGVTAKIVEARTAKATDNGDDE
ncbi:MAG: hypothetical protein H0T60_09045 [Acidobacteria bacterium]|nr:hypothetical protein [Acidobacteriota bacterium]